MVNSPKDKPFFGDYLQKMARSEFYELADFLLFQRVIEVEWELKELNEYQFEKNFKSKKNVPREGDLRQRVLEKRLSKLLQELDLLHEERAEWKGA